MNRSANCLRPLPGRAIISFLINSVYNIVDQIFIGQGVGYLGNAATTISFPIMTILISFAALVGTGGSAYAALKLGEKKGRGSAARPQQRIYPSIIISGVMMAACFLFLDPMLKPSVRRQTAWLMQKNIRRSSFWARLLTS